MTHNPFSGIEDAQVSKGGSYFKAGQYLVLIEECTSKVGRKKDDLFIVSTTVVATLTRNGGENLPGSKPSQVMNLTKHDAAMGNVKGFIAAVTNSPVEQVTGPVALACCSPGQPLKGRHALLTCEQIKTQTGGDFTLHNWQHCSPEMAQQVIEAASRLPPMPQMAAAPASAPAVVNVAPAAAPSVMGLASVQDFFKR